MKQAQIIVKNTAAILSSEFIVSGMNLFIAVLLARYLGTIGFGQYSFVLAFVSVFQLVADSGLSNIMMREVAVNKENLSYQLGVTKSLIWIMSIMVFILICLIIRIINPVAEVRSATYIMAIASLAGVHTMGYSAIFRAMEEMEYVSMASILQRAMMLSFALLVIKFGLGLREIFLSYLISNVTIWFLYYRMIVHKYLKPEIIIDPAAWWHFIKEAVPFGISTVLRKISWQVDIFILSMIGTTASVGLFTAPYKIIQTLSMVPHLMLLPLFPLHSRLAKSAAGELFRSYEKSLRLMFFLSIPVGVILFNLSDDIMSILYGNKFANAHVALKYLSFNLIVLFPTTQFLYLYSSLGRQRLFTISSLISLAINILIDIILIPRLDFIGACIGTLVADTVLFGIGIYFTKSMAREISVSKALWKPLFSGIVMWGLLAPMKGLPLYLLVPGALAGGLVYIGVNIMLKTFSRDELDFLRESLPFMRKIPAAAGGENR